MNNLLQQHHCFSTVYLSTLRTNYNDMELIVICPPFCFYCTNGGLFQDYELFLITGLQPSLVFLADSSFLKTHSESEEVVVLSPSWKESNGTGKATTVSQSIDQSTERKWVAIANYFDDRSITSVMFQTKRKQDVTSRSGKLWLEFRLVNKLKVPCTVLDH